MKNENIYRECCKGWYPIIDQLIMDINKVDSSIGILQIKEKFGGLRFYVDNHSEEVYNLISDAERKCWHTCEDCGSTKNVTTAGSGWLRTLCEECHNKRK